MIILNVIMTSATEPGIYVAWLAKEGKDVAGPGLTQDKEDAAEFATEDEAVLEFYRQAVVSLQEDKVSGKINGFVFKAMNREPKTDI